MAHAKYCQSKYPTVVNNIPKESNHYMNTLDDYADIDIKSANSQREIGESSNLAQIAQTYDYSFSDSKYADYACILAVIAQVAIDNCKRRYDVDIQSEIKRIKLDMDIKSNGYPSFWQIIKRDFSKSKVNYDLYCPMNCLYQQSSPRYKSPVPTIPLSDFFIQHNALSDRRKCKNVEQMLEKFSLLNYQTLIADNDDDYLLLRSDFNELVVNLQTLFISKNYLGLMSWLLNRTLMITNHVKGNTQINSNLKANRSLILKILYDASPDTFMKCFVEK